MEWGRYMFSDVEKELYEKLYSKNGPLMWGSVLIKTLGYSNSAAFRQSVYRGKCPVKVFDVDGRKGKYAYTLDVANWLVGLGR